MENEFPPNSNAQKHERTRPSEKAPEKKQVRRVTTNPVVQRKKPLHRKFFEAFRPEDGRGFVEYTLLEVVVPGIKDLIADASTGAIDNALGVSRSRSSRRRSTDRGGYTSYSSFSASRGRDDRRGDRRGDPREPDRKIDPAEIIVETRVEAEDVLDHLNEIISNYDAATMRDLLSMLGERHTHTDENWGWRDIRGAKMIRVSGGWLIDLPRAEPLD